MPPKRITPTETKTCAHCGAPFTRNRRPNGKLEPHSEFNTRKTCGNHCGSQLAGQALTKPHTHDPCLICGAPVTKHDHETRTAWKQRTTCSAACLKERRARNGRASAYARGETLRANAPCRACGGAVSRRDGERACDWRKRVTCSVECATEMKRRGATKRNTAVRVERKRRSPTVTVRARPARPETPAPKARVFRGFPTPAAIKSAWVPVTGGSLPPHEWNNSVTKSTPRPTNLRAALDYHPDLLTALAGLLTDSWHPHAPTPPSYEGGTT